MKTPLQYIAIVFLFGLGFKTAMAQQIVTGNASFATAQVPMTILLTTFTTSQSTPLTFSAAFSLATPTRSSSFTGSETNSALGGEVYIVNTATNVQTILEYYNDSLVYSTSTSQYVSPTAVTLSSSIDSIDPGTYQLYYANEDSNTAAGHTIENSLADVNITGPYSVTLALSISPQVQAALDEITAAYEAGDSGLAGQLTSLANELATDEGTITGLQQQLAALPTQTSITSLQQALAGAETQEASDVAALQQQINSLNSQLQATNANFSNYQKTIPAWQLYGVPFATSLGGGLAGSIFSNSALLPRPGGDSTDEQARPGYYDK